MMSVGAGRLSRLRPIGLVVTAELDLESFKHMHISIRIVLLGTHSSAVCASPSTCKKKVASPLTYHWLLAA